MNMSLNKEITIESANEEHNRLIERTLSDGSKVYGVSVFGDGIGVMMDCPSREFADALFEKIKETEIIY